MTTEYSGSGDVSRSLELLWGMAERPTRGPKPGLSLDRIVIAAVAVADAEGLDAVSMRRVATELGVGTMSLYRYLPGKAELLDLMLDHVFTVPPDAPDVVASGWRAVLEAAARGTWELCLAHPWLLQVDQARPLLGPNTMRGMEFVMSGLSGTQLSDQEKVTVVVAVDGYVTGVARVHTNAMGAERRTGTSDEEFWAAQAPILDKVMQSGEFPVMAALAEDAFDLEIKEVFEIGLRGLLDGLADRIDR